MKLSQPGDPGGSSPACSDIIESGFAAYAQGSTDERVRAADVPVECIPGRPKLLEECEDQDDTQLKAYLTQRELGVEMTDALEPRWVSPDDLVTGVTLRSLMLNPEDAALVLRDYEDYGSRSKPKEEPFAEDLAVIEAKAPWAKRLRTALVSLDVNDSGANQSRQDGAVEQEVEADEALHGWSFAG